MQVTHRTLEDPASRQAVRTNQSARQKICSQARFGVASPDQSVHLRGRYITHSRQARELHAYLCRARPWAYMVA